MPEARTLDAVLMLALRKSFARFRETEWRARTPRAAALQQYIEDEASWLADYAVWPIRILVMLPALDFLLSLQRSKWISARRPGVVTIATTLEGTGLAITLVSTVGGLNMTGAVAGAIAMIAGRLSANGYLWWRGSADPER